MPIRPIGWRFIMMKSGLGMLPLLTTKSHHPGAHLGALRPHLLLMFLHPWRRRHWESFSKNLSAPCNSWNSWYSSCSKRGVSRKQNEFIKLNIRQGVRFFPGHDHFDELRHTPCWTFFGRWRKTARFPLIFHPPTPSFPVESDSCILTWFILKVIVYPVRMNDAAFHPWRKISFSSILQFDRSRQTCWCCNRRMLFFWAPAVVVNIF